MEAGPGGAGSEDKVLTWLLQAASPWFHSHRGVRSQGRQLPVERSQIPARSQVWTALHQQGLSRGALINPSSFLQAELGKAAVAFWETIGKLDERCMAWSRERLKWGPSGPNREPKLCEEKELFSCNRRVLLEPELGSDHGWNERRHQDKLLPLNSAFLLTFPGYPCWIPPGWCHEDENEDEDV
ncbi:hypothetical protein HGM15179_006100 [Zosterops borbonicus]|uniref:Uncharacterized protein n=1 Tax=Zosterops borbonicus TaxID=364589 RepID=A0A8K1GNK9_9PASS|nr:hypothetical protein HGM15179_006100 [Zosterops borbonicus]